MTNEVKKVPELRFPEFDGEWEEKKIGELSQKAISGGTPRTSKLEFWNGDIPWIQSSDLSMNKLYIDSSNKSITEEAIDNSSAKIIPAKSIAIVTRVGVGKLAFVDFKYSTSQDFISLANLTFDTNFSIYSLYNKIKIISKNLQGTSIKGITKNELLNTVMLMPLDIVEQHKIGEFFSKLDRQIELEEQKLAKLEEQKKGYMQQIFSRQFLFENEKGDTDYSWRNFKIKDIFSKIESGNRLPKTNLVEGNIPYVIAQTTNNGVFMHISEDTLDYHKNKLKLFKKGSITISIDNPEAMFIQEMDFFTSNVMRVIHNENLKRGSHIFIMESLKKLTQSYNWSVKFSGPIIMDSTVKFPVYNDNKVNWNVVNKIGDFFNTFEIRINRQSDKIKLLKERKKGFLKKMFI
ncbi:restriction endonuclease subunit S [Staphylococcus saprophyticus]|nr:restriction endonuclease subunit S [Staphylococcus saprophyticus]RIO26747.1 restriction endonuclease subunit S [Staphylococcus saprophyticus]